MPKYFQYKPGTHGSKLRLNGGRLGYDPGQGYYRIAPGGKSVQAQRALATTAAKQNGPLDVQSIINNYFRTSMLTPEQQRKAARTQVEDAIAEQTKAFNQEREKQRARNASQQMTAEGLAIAMQAMKGADANTARQAWQQAGGDMASFAQAIAGSVQGAQQGALSQAQGTLQGGSQIIAPDPGTNAAVSTALGKLPAATAMANAEAQYQGALERGDQQGARFWDQQRALAYEQQQTETEYAGKFADIQKQRPKLLREATEAQQDRQRQELATLMSVLNVKSGLEQNEWEMQEARRKLAQEDRKLTQGDRALTIKQKAAEAAAAAAKERNKIAWASAKASQTNAQTARSKAIGMDLATGKVLPGYMIDAQGNVVVDPKQKGKAAQTGKMEIDFKKWAAQWFRDQYVDEKMGQPMQRPPTKDQLVRKIMDGYGSSIVGKNGLSKKGVEAIAQAVLDSFPDRWFTDSFYEGTYGKPKGSKKKTTTKPGGAIPDL